MVEQAFGRLKRRFWILKTGIKTDPVKAGKIIVACCLLHNLAIKFGEPVFDEEPDDNTIIDVGKNREVFVGPERGKAIRAQIAHDLLPNDK